MITIRTTNAEEVVERHKGWFAAAVADPLLDAEARIEEGVIKQVRAALAKNGVQAVVERRTA